jgi:hypothetical protein
MNQLQMINRMLCGGENPLLLELLSNTNGNTNETWIDTSVYSTNATQSNALYRPVLTNDLFGVGNKGYSFDGVNDYMIVPDSDRFTFSDINGDLPFTVKFKFILNNNNDDAWFINKRDGSTTNCEWQIVYFQGTIGIYLFSGGSNVIYRRGYFNFVPELGTVYNIKIAYSGQIGEINIFINGIQQTTTMGGSGLYVKMINTSSKLTIGSAGFNPIHTAYTLNGGLTDIEIWKGAV